MSDSVFDSVYNPDVLSCLANLSNDEVFTPPEIANQMLDMLPQELFKDPNTTFLDPACKSGVFLREITKRLIAGLEDKIPDLQERIDHILHNQVYGIAITALTSFLSRRSIYCSKYPSGKCSVSYFDGNEPQGHIIYKETEHTFKKGRCVYCKVPEKTFGKKQRKDLESHAYLFTHIKKPEEIFDMKFDVIIGNPPYQLDDGGNKASAIPIYQFFVEQAKKLNPRYLCMIIPARWYSGGKGLESFRKGMLNDDSICDLVDYTNSADCFPGVDISGGVCYFLRDRNYHGKCRFTNIYNGQRTSVVRGLNDYPTLIRYPIAVSIVSKVLAKSDKHMDKMVSTRKPFGLSTDVKPLETGDITLRYNGGTGPYLRNLITSGSEKIDDWKLIMSYLSAEHAGQPDKNGKFKILSTMEILPPGRVCTETYLLVGSSKDKQEIENLYSYMKTKFLRFLVAQIATSQHITKSAFAFVPIQDFSTSWDDDSLFQKYDLTQEEISYINSMIKEY